MPTNCSKPAASAPASAAQPTEVLPPSVVDQLRQWRLQASLRFVGKSLGSSPTPAKPRK